MIKVMILFMHILFIPLPDMFTMIAQCYLMKLNRSGFKPLKRKTFHTYAFFQRDKHQLLVIKFLLDLKSEN